MCRLFLALDKNDSHANDEAPSLFAAFRELAVQGRVPPGSPAGHLDGWGWSYWGKDGGLRLRKEAADPRLPACAQTINEMARLHPTLVIGHLRKASPGIPIRQENTHPFCREGWAFAHNGTIHDAGRIPIGNLSPEGDGDSERFFLFLLNRLRGAAKGDRATIIGQALAELDKENLDYTALNFLLSDGAEAFVSCRYRDLALTSYYQLWKREDAALLAVCSEPIGSGKWVPLENGALVVCRG
ncbi:MAG: class II glutamine amidotransferase [bacterium]